MKRVAVVGCSGSGKSTFARELARLTGLPLHHMDRIFWQPGWAKVGKDEFEQKLTQLVSGERWIIDGNYTRTAAQRFARADTVIFFDLPVWLCFFRILRRVVITYGRIRPDMADGCPERFDIPFILYVARFRRAIRPRLINALENAAHCAVICFKSSEDVARYLKNHAS